MKLIAWDTSSKTGCISALSWDEKLKSTHPQLLAELQLNVDVSQSEQLLWGIDQVLQAARWTLEDVDVFGVGVGPGSFTGLRVGITTARTLAQTQNRKLVAVSSLAALARPAALWLSQVQERTLVIAATDAAKGELFALWGSSRGVVDCVSSPDLWKRGVDEAAIKPEKLMKVLKKRIQEGKGATHWLAVGEGRLRYPEVWKELEEFQELKAPTPFPNLIQGRYVGLLCFEAVQAGLATDPLKVLPRYLRKSSAEVNLESNKTK